MSASGRPAVTTWPPGGDQVEPHALLPALPMGKLGNLFKIRIDDIVVR